MNMVNVLFEKKAEKAFEFYYPEMREQILLFKLSKM